MTTIRAVSRRTPSVNVDCVEPYVTGEVLPDGGCENLGAYLGGPGSNELPHETFGSPQYVYSDSSTAPTFAPYTAFFNFGPSGDTDYLLIASQANPRSGSSHLRAGSLWASELVVASRRLCNPDYDADIAGFYGPKYTAKINPGDQIDFEAWAAFENADSNSAEACSVTVEFSYFNSSQGAEGTDNDQIACTFGQYTQLTLTETAPDWIPANSYLVVLLRTVVTPGGSSWSHVDFDDFSVTVTPA